MMVDAAVLTQSAENPAKSDPVEAWVEVAREDGATSDEAVDKYAGKSFSPEAKPGLRRAVSLQAWGTPRYTEK